MHVCRKIDESSLGRGRGGGVKKESSWTPRIVGVVGFGTRQTCGTYKLLCLSLFTLPGTDSAGGEPGSVAQSSLKRRGGGGGEGLWIEDNI
jgi:hypothetical protein